MADSSETEEGDQPREEEAERARQEAERSREVPRSIAAASMGELLPPPPGSSTPPSAARNTPPSPGHSTPASATRGARQQRQEHPHFSHYADQPELFQMAQEWVTNGVQPHVADACTIGGLSVAAFQARLSEADHDARNLEFSLAVATALGAGEWDVDRWAERWQKPRILNDEALARALEEPASLSGASGAGSSSQGAATSSQPAPSTPDAAAGPRRQAGELVLWSAGGNHVTFEDGRSPERLVRSPGAYGAFRTLLQLKGVTRLRAMGLCTPPRGTSRASKFPVAFLRNLAEGVGTLTVKAFYERGPADPRGAFEILLVEWENEATNHVYSFGIHEWEPGAAEYQYMHEWYLGREEEHLSVFVARAGQERSHAFSLANLVAPDPVLVGPEISSRVEALKETLTSALARHQPGGPAIAASGDAAAFPSFCVEGGATELNVEDWLIMKTLVRATASPLASPTASELAAERRAGDAAQAAALRQAASGATVSVLPYTQAEASTMSISVGDTANDRSDVRFRILAISERDTRKVRWNGTIHQKRETGEYVWDADSTAKRAMRSVATALYDLKRASAMCAKQGCMFNVRFRRRADGSVWECTNAVDHTCDQSAQAGRERRKRFHAYTPAELASVVVQQVVDCSNWRQVQAAVQPYLRAEASEDFCRRIGGRLRCDSPLLRLS